jgi:ferritin-like metal-binding protein YciE
MDHGILLTLQRMLDTSWHCFRSRFPNQSTIEMRTRNSKHSEGSTMRDEMSSKLGQLFEDELRDIYWAEKALTKAIPRMIKNASSEELTEALEHHLEETQEHVSRVEQIFSMLEKQPRAKKCEGMEGIIKEAQELMKESEKGVMRDAAIISAAQKVEHYEISSYGTLRTFAQTIGLREAVPVLESTLEEEKNADKILTEVATTTVNLDAASEPEE